MGLTGFPPKSKADLETGILKAVKLVQAFRVGLNPVSQGMCAPSTQESHIKMREDDSHLYIKDRDLGRSQPC